MLYILGLKTYEKNMFQNEKLLIMINFSTSTTFSFILSLKLAQSVATRAVNPEVVSYNPSSANIHSDV